MSKQHVNKRYLADTQYHLFNRGVNKRNIFHQQKDFWVYRRIFRRFATEMSDRIRLNCYSLLPSHFHLLVWQRDERDITLLMKKVSTSYSIFYRKKYDYVEPLFESRYKAVILPTKKDIERVHRYIMKNPIEAGLINWRHVGTTI